MSLDNHEGWGEYTKLVVQELERLNDTQKELLTRIERINEKISDLQRMEHNVSDVKSWQQRVNDVWSPTQMKESKDEIYAQKNRWTATIAIITFVQVLIGILLAAKGKI